MSVLEFIRETVYFLLSHSALLAYICVWWVQIETSSILSLPMSLLVFLWATLTFPRPSKTFWILLIAYTQIVVGIKCLSQFKVIWWNSQHLYVKFLGNEHQKHLIVYELGLLMAIFLHRAVLKKFGLWTSASKYQFEEGSFLIERCDSMTTEMIQHSLNSCDVNKEISEQKIETSNSVSELISDEENAKQKIIYKHELRTDYVENKVMMNAVYKDQSDWISAQETVFKDDKGQNIIKLCQEGVKLKLRLLDPSDLTKVYPVDRLTVVDNLIEEPLDFLPSSTMMAIKRHAYMISNFVELMRPKHNIYERKRVDVYKYMFLCDFINFLVLLLGFEEFVVSFVFNK